MHNPSKNDTNELKLDFVSSVYEHNPALAERLSAELEKALKTLNEREELFIRERDDVAGFKVHSQIRAGTYLDPVILSPPPDKFAMSHYTVPAMTEFMRRQLHSKEFDVRTVLAVLKGKEENVAALWLTAIGLKKRNSIGGYDLVEPASLFIDSAAAMPPNGEKVTIDKIGNLGKYGLELYDPSKRMHGNSRGCDEVDCKAERMLPAGDRIVNGLYESLCAPDKLRDFHKRPDWLGGALIESLKEGNLLSDKIKAKILKALDMDNQSEEKK